MNGGRMLDGRWRAQAASLLVSALWLVTMLSLVGWSAAPIRPSNLPQLRPVTAAVGQTTPAETSVPAAVAQLPVAPAVAEKRPSASAGPTRSGTDSAAIIQPRNPPPDRQTARAGDVPCMIGTPEGPVLALAGARAPPRLPPMARRA